MLNQYKTVESSLLNEKKDAQKILGTLYPSDNFLAIRTSKQRRSEVHNLKEEINRFRETKEAHLYANKINRVTNAEYKYGVLQQYPVKDTIKQASTPINLLERQRGKLNFFRFLYS